jgi:acyl-CoA thioester hydrolase
VKDHSVKLELRIDWSDIDLFGHVNNLAILKYVQAARVLYLETIGLMKSQSENKTGPILANINCQFRKPLFYPGKVALYSGVDEIKNTSFRIHHAIYNDNNEIAAVAQDIMVYFDYRTNAKLLLPDDVREKIESMKCAKGNHALIE